MVHSRCYVISLSVSAIHHIISVSAIHHVISVSPIMSSMPVNPMSEAIEAIEDEGSMLSFNGETIVPKLIIEDRVSKVGIIFNTLVEALSVADDESPNYSDKINVLDDKLSKSEKILRVSVHSH